MSQSPAHPAPDGTAGRKARAWRLPAGARAADLERAIVQAEQAVMQRDARWLAQLHEFESHLRRGAARVRRAAGWVGGAALLLVGVVGLWRRLRPRRAVARRAPAAQPRNDRSLWLAAVAFLQPLWSVGMRALHLPSSRSAAVPVLLDWWERRRAAARAPLQTVARVDLQRYAGTWYEVARLPMRHEAACAADAVACYEPGVRSIRIVNTCRRQDGSIKRAEGSAYVVRDSGGARLRVSFAPAWLRWLPGTWGDYCVLWLDLEYTAALVGTPDRRYLWLLSRSPVLEETVWQRMVGHARAQGFDVDRLIRTPHTVASR